jgi:maltose-binding protein MalE
MRALVDGFERGDLAILVADSLQLAHIEETAQDPDSLGIAPIPGYPTSQPFSTVELVVVSSASTQKDVAALLINFLANETQQRRFARSISGRVPVNRQVIQLDPTLYPRASAILQQARASIVPTVAQDQLLNALILSADPVYQQVLEGILSPQEGAQQIIETLKSDPNGK